MIKTNKIVQNRATKWENTSTVEFCPNIFLNTLVNTVNLKSEQFHIKIKLKKSDFQITRPDTSS